MKVLLRQTVDLYGTRYSVGLRDIPDGHACGDDWDIYVKAGWIVPQVKPAEPEAVAEVVVVEQEAEPESEVAVDAVSETAEVEAEPEAVAEVSTRKKK